MTNLSDELVRLGEKPIHRPTISFSTDGAVWWHYALDLEDRMRHLIAKIKSLESRSAIQGRIERPSGPTIIGPPLSKPHTPKPTGEQA